MHQESSNYLVAEPLPFVEHLTSGVHNLLNQGSPHSLETGHTAGGETGSKLAKLHGYLQSAPIT